MKSISKKTKIFVGIVLAIALLIALFAFTGGPSTKSATPTGADGLASTTGVPAIPGGGAAPDASIDQFSALLSTVQSISIDTTIFTDPAYLSLRDHPITLGTDIVGRPNPFAAIGTDSQATSTSSVSVQTIQPGNITKTSAQFSALVTLTDTTPVSVIFEYGTTDALDMATSPLTATHTGTTLSTVSDLTPGTLYYVRADVVKGSITTQGNVMTFTTAK